MCASGDELAHAIWTRNHPTSSHMPVKKETVLLKKSFYYDAKLRTESHEALLSCRMCARGDASVARPGTKDIAPAEALYVYYSSLYKFTVDNEHRCEDQRFRCEASPK